MLSPGQKNNSEQSSPWPKASQSRQNQLAQRTNTDQGDPKEAQNNVANLTQQMYNLRIQAHVKLGNPPIKVNGDAVVNSTNRKSENPAKTTQQAYTKPQEDAETK